jgi:uncharacterized damage-inducible protein DinB
MDLVPHFQKMFAHDAWANQEAIAMLRVAGDPPQRALRFMAHVVSAEWLWMARLKQWKQEFPVWPEWTLSQCEAQAGKLPPLWQELLRGMKPAGLDQPVAYRNSKGEDWSSAIGDILTHVLLHSSYHRGQVASELRAAGHAPVLTDYIHAVRQGFVR